MIQILAELRQQNWRGAIAWSKLTFFCMVVSWAVLPGSEWLWAKTAPATDWIEYQKIEIPDFRVGENPRINAFRFIKRETVGTWYARIMATTGETICNGAGESFYRPDLVYPPSTLFRTTLNEYVGDSGCSGHITPGSYFIDIDIVWSEFGVRKRLTFKSPVFSVKD